MFGLDIIFRLGLKVVLVGSLFSEGGRWWVLINSWGGLDFGWFKINKSRLFWGRLTGRGMIE